MNKKLFFLSLLVITTATQCMENNSEEFSLTAPDKRFELVSKLMLACPNIKYPYYHENHTCAIDVFCSEVKVWQGVSINGYSFLGFAAIAINVFPSLEMQKYPEYAPYDDRKDFIKTLMLRGFKPTNKDRELAFMVEKEARILRHDGKSDLFDE